MSQSSEPLVWLVTGCSSGFGNSLVSVLLKAGHRVIASSRNPSKTPDLVKRVEDAGGKWIILDVTASNAKDIVKDAIDIFGRIDVLVNNAGFGIFAPLEDSPAKDIRSQFDTNVFAPIEVVRAVVPSMRERKTGAIVNIGSVSGYYASVLTGAYGATKHALEAISESFGTEIAAFGINTLLIDPGPFKTNGLGTDSVFSIIPSEPYQAGPVVEARKVFQAMHATQRGDPDKAAHRILELVTNTGLAAGKALKWGEGGFMRVPLGDEAVGAMRGKAKAFAEEADKWAELAGATAFD